MAGLRLSGISKQFDEVSAVSGIDLKVADGEFFSLLGPSGCGKTTLLRMIAGYTNPTAGTIHLGSRDVTRDPPERRNAGMVFQNYALFPHLTAEKNVAFGLEVRNLPLAERNRRVRSALEMVGLEALAQRPVPELSGGEQQRVALARAIVIEPEVLLLDEPLSNLDAARRVDTREEIRRIQRELKITTIYVTHDQEEALVLSDRIAVMRKGKVEQVDNPRDIYARPGSRFVGEFIGRANFISAVLAIDEKQTGLLELEGGSAPIFVSSLSAGVEAGKVEVMVRPEDIRIVGSAESVGQGADKEWRVQGRVLSTEFSGASVRLHVALEAADEGQVLTVLRPWREVRTIGEGDAVELRVSNEAFWIVNKG